jgi:hypothetical protein
MYTVRIEPDPKDKQRYAEDQRYKKAHLDKAGCLNIISGIAVVIALLALIGLVVNACIIHRQLAEMQKQTKLMHKQFVASDAAVVKITGPDMMIIGRNGYITFGF